MSSGQNAQVGKRRGTHARSTLVSLDAARTVVTGRCDWTDRASVVNISQRILHVFLFLHGVNVNSTQALRDAKNHCRHFSPQTFPSILPLLAET
jgi:hypothetical protein